MENNSAAALEDLIEQLEKVEKMIQMHLQNPEGSFMVAQYQSIKAKKFQELIYEIVNHLGEAYYPVISSALAKYYPANSEAKLPAEVNNILLRLKAS